MLRRLSVKKLIIYSIASGVFLTLLSSSCPGGRDIRLIFSNSEISIDPSPVFIENDSLKFRLNASIKPIRKPQNLDLRIAIILESDTAQQVLDTLSFPQMSVDERLAQNETLLVQEPLQISLTRGFGNIAVSLFWINEKNGAYKMMSPVAIEKVFTDSSAYLIYLADRLPLD